MSKQPSDATTIRTLRRDLRSEHEISRRLTQENHVLRGRLTKAEQETAEWKRRFDLLLSRTPETKP